MSPYRVDLRSDTVTRPSDAMRRAMASAEVGDAWYGDDPTVNLLQERAAELTGTEAALYVATGTMANQIGVRLHVRVEFRREGLQGLLHLPSGHGLALQPPGDVGPGRLHHHPRLENIR